LRSRPGVPTAVLIALALLAASLLGAASASAAGVVNGSFETGTFNGWSLFASSPSVEWLVGEDQEPGAQGQPLPAPFDGRYFAFSEQRGPGTAILYQDIALPAATTDTLALTFGYFSEAQIRIPQPDSLDAEGAAKNQQVRVDVMKPTAPIESLAPADILTTVFASSEAENLVPEPGIEPRRFSVDLSAFAGQTVRLRFAVAVNRELEAEVDAVSLTSAPIPPALPAPPAPLPAPVPPSNQIRKGKLALNKKNGTASLAIAVPDAGTLTAMDASTKIAIASTLTAKGGHKPMLIKTTTLHPTAAGTIEVPIRPTASGRRVLEEKGALEFHARLTFTPTGGTAATQVYTSKLMKTLKPRPRR
jgi:hypothetical protein